jgi:hypothetical protein
VVDTPQRPPQRRVAGCEDGEATHPHPIPRRSRAVRQVPSVLRSTHARVLGPSAPQGPARRFLQSVMRNFADRMLCKPGIAFASFHALSARVGGTTAPNHWPHNFDSFSRVAKGRTSSGKWRGNTARPDTIPIGLEREALERGNGVGHGRNRRRTKHAREPRWTKTHVGLGPPQMADGCTPFGTRPNHVLARPDRIWCDRTAKPAMTNTFPGQMRMAPLRN